MNAERTVMPPSRLGQFLAVLSVATFWLLPLSPFIAMAAVSVNSNSKSWAREVSVAGTVLCALYTIALASWIAFLYFWMLPG